MTTATRNFEAGGSARIAGALFGRSRHRCLAVLLVLSCASATPCFAIEEEAVFPVLGSDHPLVRQALAEHAQLTQDFLRSDHDERSIAALERSLDAHIRFEERVLFQEVQKLATEEQLDHIEEVHGGISDHGELIGETDPFWK